MPRSAADATLGRAGHLVGRFLTSLMPRRVGADDRAWVASVLEPPELELWSRLGRADRAESVRVARRTERALATHGDTRGGPRGDTLGGTADDRAAWLAAALLHDVGKLDARFGPYRRSVATIAGAVAPTMVPAWREAGGFARRVALYLQHAELGEVRIRVVGGREVAAKWAGAHHDPSRWAQTGIPIAVCAVLARADGERVTAA